MFRRNKQKSSQEPESASASSETNKTSGDSTTESVANQQNMAEGQDESAGSEEIAASAAPEGGASAASGEYRTAADVDAESIKKLETELKDTYDKYLRSVAELENYKKRAIKERSDLLKYAAEGFAQDLLEIADGIQLAVQREYPGANEELVKGFQMILNQLLVIFDKHGIRADSAVGKMFEPDKHQALATVPTKEKPPGTVLEEFKRAYFYKDKLLRAGQVVVAAEDKSAGGSEDK